MNKYIRIKSLIAISFIVFTLPFLQTCSNNSLKKLPAYDRAFTGVADDSIAAEIKYNKVTKTNDTIRNYIEASKVEKQKIIANENIAKQIWLEKTKKEYTYNAYFLGFGIFKEFKLDNLSDKVFYIMLNFTLIILSTFIMLIISFRKKFKQIMVMSSLNLVFLFVATFSLYLLGQIEDMRQIKYGYYLFVLNSILIIIESRNEFKKTKT